MIPDLPAGAVDARRGLLNITMNYGGPGETIGHYESDVRDYEIDTNDWSRFD